MRKLFSFLTHNKNLDKINVREKPITRVIEESVKHTKEIESRNSNYNNVSEEVDKEKYILDPLDKLEEKQEYNFDKKENATSSIIEKKPNCLKEIESNFNNISDEGKFDTEIHELNHKKTADVKRESTNVNEDMVYIQIESQYNKNILWIEKIVNSTSFTKDSAFLFCLFHHKGIEKLEEGNFGFKLMKFLKEKNLLQFNNVNQIRRFLNDNALYLVKVANFGRLGKIVGSYSNYVITDLLSEVNISILNNITLVGDMVEEDNIS